MMVCVIVSIYCIVFAQNQRNDAKEVLIRSAENERLLMENIKHAKVQEQLANKQGAMAIQAQSVVTRLQNELEACEKTGQ